MQERRAAEEAVVATTEDRDGSSLDTTARVPAEGDDIVVVPGTPGAPRRSRAVLALAGIGAALLIAGAIALVARNHDPAPVVRTVTPSTIATEPVAAQHDVTVPKQTVPAVAATTPAPTLPPQTAPPQTAPPQTAVTSGAVVPPPTAPPATVATPPRHYGASALTWNAPASLTIASGKTAALSVTAHNPTDGTVTLAHPLSCTPRLDHTEMCIETVQLIGSGQSASAQYTIDAKGIAPGHYTLKIEGVLTVAVTVS